MRCGKRRRRECGDESGRQEVRGVEREKENERG